MRLLASSSQQLPHDSLSSPCFLLSESYGTTEDEVSSGVSSEGEGETCSGKPSPGPFALGKQTPQGPERHLVYGECSSKHENGPILHCHRTSKCAGLTSASATRKGDFSRKCAELRGYVIPLLELLNGLKTGKYDRGLSTLQQSVAVDRLQRIVGVLQKPPNGEKYMHILLQVEMMLKVWFPQVASHPSTPLTQNSTSNHPPHRLQLPVKKRHLGWSEPEPRGLAYLSYKRARGEDQEWPPSQMISGLARMHAKDAKLRNETPVMPKSEGVCNPETHSDNLSSRETRGGLARVNMSLPVLPPPPTSGCCVDTQDSLVSSTSLTSGLC